MNIVSWSLVATAFIADSYVWSKSMDLDIGVYGTVSESECNIEIVLKNDGVGTWAEVCRVEARDHSDLRVEVDIAWSSTEYAVFIVKSGMTTEYRKKLDLSCAEFGGSGASRGLIGPGGVGYWKAPRLCR